MTGAVRVLLGTLRFGDPDRGELRREWQAADLSGLRELLRYEGCELWLFRRLKALDLFDALQDDIASHVDRSARDNAAMNLLLDAQVRATAALLNGLGAPHVLLKGSAMRRVAGRVPYADARSPRDVDVLVPESEARRAWEGLCAAGYRVAYDPSLTPADLYHLLPLVSDLPSTVEVHTSTSYELSPAEAWTRFTDGAIPVEVDGILTRVPRSTELFWHAFAHAVRHGPEWLRLRALLDGAALWASSEPLDWALVRSRLESAEVVHAPSARLWLGAMRWLAGDHAQESGLGLLPHEHLARLLEWRLRVLRTSPWRPWKDKLLEEGGRVELGFPRQAVAIAGVGALRRARRWAAATLARRRYSAWRRSFNRSDSKRAPSAPTPRPPPPPA